MRNSLLLSCLFSLCLAAPLAKAGECKIKAPAPETIVDAKKMAIVTELQVNRLAAAYKQATGKELKVVFVARAGQDLSGAKVLRDYDTNGRPLTVQVIARAGEKTIHPTDGEPEANRNQVKKAIREMYADPASRLTYSHVGILIRSHPFSNEEDLPNWWAFRHQLRPCIDDKRKKEGFIKNRPYLWDEGIGRFYSDNPSRLRAQILVPKPEYQDRLATLALNDVSAQAFHGSFYNAAASWRNVTEQNSNQWPLELLAASTKPLGEVRTREHAQRILAETGYMPSKVLLYGKFLLPIIPGTNLIAPYITLHSREQPHAVTYNLAEIITALSLERYMIRNQMLQFAPVEIEIAQKTPPAKKTKQSGNK